MNHTTIDFDTAEARFNVSEHLYGAHEDTLFLLVEGDTQIASLDLDEDAGEGVYAYIIDGDLTVDQDISASDDESTSLLVTGSLHTKSVWSAGSELVVLKNVTCTDYALGSYNHGHFTIKGDLTTPYVLNSDHALSWDGTLHGTSVDLYNFERYSSFDYCISDLVPECLDEDERSDLDKVLELVEAGKPIIKA